jgi:hypothetical protein
MLLGGVTVLTYVCQWFVFERNSQEIALSILLGTCMTLLGAFAALLASPYGAEDEKRLSKISATIFTLLTGYVLAKIIDPLVGKMTSDPSALLHVKNVANILVRMIGFLGGFLGTYAFRAYVTIPDNGLEIKTTSIKVDALPEGKSAELAQAAETERREGVSEEK